MVKEPTFPEDILLALSCPAICVPQHCKKDFLACVSHMAHNYIQFHLHAQVKKTWTRCRIVCAVMVHFGTGTVQQSVLDIIAMSEVEADLRHILATPQETVTDSPSQREKGPASSTEGQVPTNGQTKPLPLVIVDAVKDAPLYAVKQMVKYRSEKAPLGTRLQWKGAFLEP